MVYLTGVINPVWVTFKGEGGPWGPSPYREASVFPGAAEIFSVLKRRGVRGTIWRFLVK